MAFILNGTRQEVPPEWRDETLLALVREHFGLTGAKYGCGAGLCGACTVLVDGQATPACQMAAAELEGAEVRTVEGLARGGILHPVQQAWLDLSVPQCGYCQAGQIMSAVELLEQVPHPTEAEVELAMDGNLCRCGTYPRIRAAIARASGGL